VFVVFLFHRAGTRFITCNYLSEIGQNMIFPSAL
jgi:hypothetical protein